MNLRQAQLLAAIIDEFTKTALPVGSKQILDHGMFSVSGATIRNEMRLLSAEGFIEQPHTSSGRVPTVKGYRVFVQEYMDPTSHERSVRTKFDHLREQYFEHKDRERVYEAVALLAHMIPDIAFATVPHRERVYYLGLANVMKQPEFQADNKLMSDVVEVLEHRLADVIDHVTLQEKIQYYIGEKDLCAEFQSCSMLVTKYRVRDQVGAVGILGPTRMDYGYNTVALDMVASLIRD